MALNKDHSSAPRSQAAIPHLARLTRRCGRRAKAVLLQQLPFFAWPGGQKPPRPPPWPGSTTTEPLGVYTAQPVNRAANKVNPRSFFMGAFVSY